MHAKFGVAGGATAIGAGRVRLLLAPALLALVALLLLLHVANAQAEVVHPYLETFGSASQPSFSNPGSLAVDPATGDLLVVEYNEEYAGSSTVERFSSDGEPADFSALGTNVIDGKAGPGGEPCAVEPASCDETPGNAGVLSSEGFSPSEVEVAVAPPGSASGTAGDIYLTDAFHEVVDVFAPSGEYLGQISAGFACGVAVGADGTVFAGDYYGSVHKYVPTAPGSFDNPANYSTSTANYSASTPCQVAAGYGAEAGYVFAQGYNGEISKIDSEGAEEGEMKYTFAPHATQPISFDPTSGEILASSLSEVAFFDASGASGAVQTSSINTPSKPQGTAVDGPSGKIYLDRAGEENVEVIGPAVQAPAATTEAATAVEVTSATLLGTINAEEGSATSCQFEYVTAAQFEADGYAGAQTIPCVPSGPVTGSEPHAVEAHAEGLHPGTEYAFRLVARNEDRAEAFGSSLFFTMGGLPYPTTEPFGPCGNDEFRTGPSSELPDCRAYEQVTPIDKNSGGVGGHPDMNIASLDGDGMSFFSQAGIPGGQGAQDFPSFISRRGDGSWSTKGTMPPASLGEYASILAYSPDLRYVFTTATEGNSTGLFLEDASDGSITTIVPYFDSSSAGFGNIFGIDGFNSDASRVIFESTLPLTGETPPGQPHIFVWTRGSGISLADILHGGGVPSGSVLGGAYDWYNDHPSEGGALQHMYVYTANATAPEADQIYFTVSATGELLLRTGLSSGSPSTLVVNESHKTNGSGPGGSDPNGPQPAIFLEASANGSRSFFLSPAELTNDANTGSADQGMDLYRFEPNGGAPILTDMTPDAADPNGAEVQGTLGISEDGSVVYFAANGVLAPGASAGNCDNQAGSGDDTPRACSIYRLDDSSGTPEITFVARIDGTSGFGSINDAKNWSPASYNPYAGTGGNIDRTARVSANGNVLLFASVRNLTGSENRSSACPTPSSAKGPCSEFFRYDAEDEGLDCVSCNETGASPLGPATLLSREINTPLSTNGVRLAVRTRNLSADGNRIFFQSSDPLVPEDTNTFAECGVGVGGGTPQCQDVYEWEAEGSGSCHASNYNGGCLYLLSGGREQRPSWFGDADRSGDNVFIFTSEQMVPTDRDEAVDIYDAKVGGGLAAQDRERSTPCSGEAACLGQAAGSPAQSSAGSATFVGPSNPKPRLKHHREKRCGKKGKHGKRVGCRHHKHHRHHERHHRHSKHRVSAHKSNGGGK